MGFLKMIYWPRWIKFFMFIPLLFVLGLPQACWQNHAEEIAREKSSPSLSPEEHRKVLLLYDQFLERKETQARKKIAEGGRYAPKDYFNDMRDERFERERLGMDRLVNHSLVRPGTNNLWALIKEQLEIHHNYDELKEAQKDYEDLFDPAYESRKKAFADLRVLGWSGILIWFFFLYLKAMPFALGLFMVWIWEGQEQKNESLFPNPLKLLWALLLYPIVIGKVFCGWAKRAEREYRAEAELRRTKESLFTYLSLEETQKIKRFGKSAVSLSCWRERLVALGLRPRHSFVAALAVTLLLSLTPFFGQEESQAKEKELMPKIAWEQILEQGQHLPRADIEKDAQSQYDNNLPAIVFDEFLCLTRASLAIIFRAIEDSFRFMILCRRIDHIPITGYSILEISIKNPIE